jgi:hypothetical protein
MRRRRRRNLIGKVNECRMFLKKNPNLWNKRFKMLIFHLWLSTKGITRNLPPPPTQCMPKYIKLKWKRLAMPTRGGAEALICCKWICIMVQPLWKNCLESSKFNFHLLWEPVIPYLCIYPRAKKAYVYPKTCMWVLLAILFVVTSLWKQLRYSSKDGYYYNCYYRYYR